MDIFLLNIKYRIYFFLKKGSQLSDFSIPSSQE